MKHLLPLIFLLCIVVTSQAQVTATIIDSAHISCNGGNDGFITASAVGYTSSTIVISEANANTPDFVELTNVSGGTLNTNGWFVATSDDYTNINDVNGLTWSLPTTVPSGWVDFREDVTGLNYWGNNLFWNPGNTGWLLVSDNNGNIVDLFFWGWLAADIANWSVTINGFTFTAGSDWIGDGLPSTCSTSYIRSGSLDNDDNTDWSCGAVSKGVVNGSLTVPFGGVGLGFDWSTGDTTATITGLTAGTYTVTVTDTNGLTDTKTVTLTEPAPLDVAIVSSGDVLCNGDSSGFAITSTTGGTMPYAYSWSTGETGADELSLLADTHTVWVTDTNGCMDSATVIINEPGPITANITTTSPLCNGDTNGSAFAVASGPGAPFFYVWSSGDTSQTAANLVAGNYVLTVSNNVGCIETFTAQVTQPAVLNVSFPSITDVLCNGGSDGTATAAPSGGTTPYNYSWPSGGTDTLETGLAAGMHTVTVTDANGCIKEKTVTVPEPTALSTILLTVDVTCKGGDDGAAMANVSGGIPPYSYLWDDPNTQTDSNATGLEEGSYDVLVTDANGCTQTTNTSVGFVNNLPVVDLGPDQEIQDGSSYTLDAGNGFSAYDWSDGSGGSLLIVTQTGTYWVEVTDHDGCKGSDTAFVSIWPTGIIETGSGVSVTFFPNPSDGLVQLETQGLTADASLSVINTIGQVVLTEQLTGITGTYRHNIDLTNQPKGVYMIKLDTGVETLVSRISVK